MKYKNKYLALKDLIGSGKKPNCKECATTVSSTEKWDEGLCDECLNKKKILGKGLSKVALKAQENFNKIKEKEADDCLKTTHFKDWNKLHCNDKIQKVPEDKKNSYIKMAQKKAIDYLENKCLDTTDLDGWYSLRCETALGLSPKKSNYIAHRKKLEHEEELKIADRRKLFYCERAPDSCDPPRKGTPEYKKYKTVVQNKCKEKLKKFGKYNLKDFKKCLDFADTEEDKNTYRKATEEKCSLKFNDLMNNKNFGLFKGHKFLTSMGEIIYESDDETKKWFDENCNSKEQKEQLEKHMENNRNRINNRDNNLH